MQSTMSCAKAMNAFGWEQRERDVGLLNAAAKKCAFAVLARLNTLLVS